MMSKQRQPKPPAAAEPCGGPAHNRDTFVQLQAAATDPQGSYTGVPRDPYEKPVQDADDL